MVEPHQPYCEQQFPNTLPSHVTPKPQCPSVLTGMVPVGVEAVEVEVEVARVDDDDDDERPQVPHSGWQPFSGAQ
mgnify:CR=1 FL=1